MSTSNHRLMGPSASNYHHDPPPHLAQRTHRSVTGCTYKAKWHPNQTRLRAAKHLNDCLLPRFDEIVKFKDPAGDIHNIAVIIHDDMQWFEDRSLQMMEFYNLQEEVQIHYTYTLNNDFELKIWRPHGLGEIQYPQRRRVHREIRKEPQEVIDIEDDIEIKEEPQEVIDIPDDLPDDLQQFPKGVAANVLWTTKITKAQEGGRQGLVKNFNHYFFLCITFGAYNYFFHYKAPIEDQQVLLVYVPNRGVQPWKLLWNTKIAKHCRVGQGWYRYCREKGLKAVEAQVHNQKVQVLPGIVAGI
ncbi:hypothetical protein SESBI_45267 [Sesbania bispinosa]|nr:hypothetical protein SESBI_45267 [Sesbania bispinosa]